MLKNRNDLSEYKIEVTSAGFGFTPTVIKRRKTFGWKPEKMLFGLPPHKYVIESMRRRGLDISRHVSKKIDEKLIKNADLLIVFEDDMKDIISRRYQIDTEKISTLQKLSGYNGYLVNNKLPKGAFIFNSDIHSWEFADWYLEACVTEIELMLWRSVDNIKEFLNKKL